MTADVDPAVAIAEFSDPDDNGPKIRSIASRDVLALGRERDRLTAENAALRAMLKRLEWNGWGEVYCTACGMEPDAGRFADLHHKPGCALAALLVEGKQT